MALAEASDGLPARLVHEWSDEKLHYIERYMDIFTTAMKDKWRLVYVDLFAGPGLCIDQRTGNETRGSPLRAQAFESFELLYLNDLDPLAVAALRERLGNDARSLVRQMHCDDAALDAREMLFGGRYRSTLGLAVIDPEGFEVSFEAIRRMTAGLRIDLIVTFMTGYVRRFRNQPGFAEAVDRFVGTTEWRAAQTTRELLDVYENQLRGIGYPEVDDDVRIVNSRESTIYHLVFASRHPRGREFFRKISDRSYSGQVHLPLDWETE